MNWNGERSSVEQRIFRWGAAGLCETHTIRLHRLVVFQPAQRLLQYLSGSDVWRHDDPVMHPLSFASSRNNPRAAKIRQVSRYLGLRSAKNLHQVADANFLLTDEVQQTQPRVVAKCLKESLDVESPFRHSLCIRLDECECKEYSRLSRCEVTECPSSFWSQ